MIQTYNALIELLGKYCGETGQSEGAVKTLTRLLDELKIYRQQIKKLIKIIDDIDTR